MKKEINQRFEQLIAEGKQKVQNLRRDNDGGISYYIDEFEISDYQAWVSSSSNLIRTVSPEKSYFTEECQRLVTEENMKHRIPAHVIQKLYGLLTSAFKEWENGLLKNIEFMIAGETFDDFLDHAIMYHKGNKVIESSVLASAVLEDTIKKIAKKHQVSSEGKTLEPLIDDLVTNNIFTSVKAKRVKSYAAVRNHALHAEWDQLDIRDVGEMIKGVQDLIENYL